MDLSKLNLSTQDLQAIADGNFEGLSNEGLAKLDGNIGVDDSNVLNERHEDISFGDRAIVKNFSSNADSSINYLRKNNPNLEFRSHNNEIIVRNPVDEKWRKLDPSTFELEDISDIGYDVLGGIGEGAAIGAAGLSTGGVGAIAAAAGAGAAVEGGRQAIGDAFGIEDNYDLGDIALSGAISGALPVGGKALKGAKKFLVDDYAERAAKMTGFDSDTIANAAKDEAKRLEIAEIGVDDFIDNEVRNPALESFRGAKADAGQRLNDAVESLDEVDISSIKSDVANRMNEFEGGGYISSEKYDVMQDFNEVLQQEGDIVSGARAREIRDYFYNISQGKMDGYRTAKSTRVSDPAQKLRLNEAKGIYKNIVNNIDDQFATSNPEKFAQFKEANNDFVDMFGMFGTKDKGKRTKFLESTDDTNRALYDIVYNQSQRNSTKLHGAQKALDRLGELSGKNVNLKEKARQLDSYYMFDPQQIASRDKMTPFAQEMGGGFGRGVGFAATRSYAGGQVGGWLGKNTLGRLYTPERILKKVKSIDAKNGQFKLDQIGRIMSSPKTTSAVKPVYNMYANDDE